MTDRWFDDAAGPVVRPYAMTRGRTRSSVDAVRLDLIALVIVEEPRAEHGPGYDDPLDDHSLAPEHLDIIEMCRSDPQSVAELSSELDLPVGVVRVLIGDLLEAELVRVTRPVPPAELPDENILREVINGLRAL
jgi:hypothetical protein